MSQLETDREKEKPMSTVAEDFAPRRYSRWASAKTATKLALIACGVLALLWMADTLIAS